MKKLIVCASLLSCIVGCASITTLEYQAQPARIADPRAEVKAIILANTVQGCISEPELTEAMLVVKFVCSSGGGGVGNAIVRFDSVESIALQMSGEWYRVLLHHRQGAKDFAWTSKNRADMERLADALTALSRRNDAPPAPSIGSST